MVGMASKKAEGLQQLKLHIQYFAMKCPESFRMPYLVLKRTMRAY